MKDAMHDFFFCPNLLRIYYNISIVVSFGYAVGYQFTLHCVASFLVISQLKCV